MSRDPFGDVEEMLVEHLTPRGWVVTSTPGDLRAKIAEHGFVIRVGRVGGGESASKSSDEPRVSVQVYGTRSTATPRATHDHAALIRADMLSLPVITAAGRLDSAVTESGPTEFAWPDPSVIAVQMIFRLSTRR